MTNEARKLLVVPSDPLHALGAKGYDGAWLRRYYNPGGCFDEVRLLNVFAEDDTPLPMIDVAVGGDMDVWRETNANPWQHDEVAIETLRENFPGLPQEWITAAREFAPDCIRAYDPAWSGLLAVELAEALGVPSLVSVHNTRGLCGGVLRRADCVMAVSEGVAQRCIGLGAPDPKVVTVFNRVDREHFTPEGKSAGGPDGSPRLLSIARDAEQKNLDRLLDACERAQSACPDLKLVHIGQSSRDWSRWEFARHIDAVPHDEIPSWMRWADALLLPSLYEGFGVALAEAHACGLPCIASDREPMNEIVTHKWDGLLVDPENTPAIAGAIQSIADPGTRERLAAPARTSSERFDISEIEKRESGLYHWLLRDEWPKVSVVLPTYNRAKRARDAIRNVLEQGYPNFELIIVNDGSTDGTREMLDKLDDERVTVIQQENKGLPRALNAGFEKATGKYWTWTSDDNAYHEGAIAALARELELNPDAGLVYGNQWIVDEHGEGRLGKSAPAEMLDTGNRVGACFMYRASVAKVIGEYDPDYTLVEDWDYWLRIRRHAKLVYLNRVMYTKGESPDTLSRTQYPQVQEMHLKLLARENANRPDVEDQLYQHLVHYSATSKNYGLTRVAISAAWRAVKKRPLAGKSWRALFRVLTPLPVLRTMRKIRGLDAG